MKRTLRLWRVFPWDSSAPPGKPFSANAHPAGQGSGRFDIPHLTPIRYLAESPEHAVGERIQTLRGQRLTQANLEWRGMPLALIGVDVTAEERIIDLCNPHELVKHECAPDTLASQNRKRTQGLAEQLYTTGAAGFRWWSSVIGDWHATILFANRIAPETLLWDDAPQILTLDHPAVRAAAAMLGMYLPPHGQ